MVRSQRVSFGFLSLYKSLFVFSSSIYFLFHISLRFMSLGVSSGRLSWCDKVVFLLLLSSSLLFPSSFD